MLIIFVNSLTKEKIIITMIKYLEKYILYVYVQFIHSINNTHYT